MVAFRGFEFGLFECIYLRVSCQDDSNRVTEEEVTIISLG